MTKQRLDMYQSVTDRMIASLEAGVAPWHKPWATMMPMSMSTGRAYRGINIFLLAPGEGEGGNWWGTYNQITERGGKVRPGESGTTIVYWGRVKGKADENGERDTFMMLRYYYVFNATQVEWADGMPDQFKTVLNHDNPIAEAEAVVAGYPGRPAIIHGGDRARYIPSMDRINMPVREAFESAEAYYSTLFHEFGHSTGHEKRLNRDGVTNPVTFASHTYGVEELIAELTAAMLNAVVGIECQHDASAAYLASWLDTIKANPKMVVQAAGKAQRAADHILGVEWPQD